MQLHRNHLITSALWVAFLNCACSQDPAGAAGGNANAGAAGPGTTGTPATPGAGATANATGTPGSSSTAPGSGLGPAGVVIDGMCYPLCTMTTTGSADAPDWGFENDASCVVPGSPTATAQACTVGQPLPPPEDLPPTAGVVIDMTCYPLCMTVTTPSDPTAPDWGYENNYSCVLPGTKTAVAQPCTTGQPVPDICELGPRPGVVVLDNGTGVTSCVPFCTASTDPALDPEGDDWDYEYGGSCVIPNTATSMNQKCNTCEELPPPVAKPGVVVVDGAGVAECVPLCVINNDPGLDPEGDDWAYEDNSSCVIPNTAPALTNIPCTTGEPIPPDMPRPGVVVTNAAGELECVANCTFYTSPTQDGANDDGFADDWAWENNNECIIPGTITSQANQACTTLEALPEPEPKPGIYINSDPVEDSCTTTECVPLCQVVTEGADPEYPDWGWEFNNSCVIPGTVTANVIGGDPEKSVENHGYEVPPRSCTWGEAEPDFLSPPPLDAARMVSPTFYIEGSTLMDPYGNPFLIRGVNNSDGWYDTCGQYAAFGALDNIAEAGANAVRVGWAFESIDPVGPGMGDPEKPVIGTNPELLAEILYRIVELKMIPILALNDSTGQTDTEWPRTMAQFITAPGYREILDAYEPYLLVGIANEWNGTQFLTAYNQAVDYFRGEGINHTLVVTANDWGQGCQAILDDGQAILDNDPQGNVLFDIHIYTYLTYGDMNGGSAQIVSGCLNDIAAANLPLLVGEFGFFHGDPPEPVAWETIVERANANSQGMTPWLWYGDTEYSELNLNESWEGPLTDWGNDIVPLAMDGQKASIFE